MQLDDPYYHSQNAVFRLIMSEGVLYRKHTGLISDFYQTLTDLLCTNNIDIVLGDFNTKST